MVTTASLCLKLKVVLWKNLIIRKHHWFLTILEVAIPVVLFVLIAYSRAKIDSLGKEYVATPSYTTPLTTQDFYYQKFTHGTKIYYAPNTDFLSSLFRNVQLKFNINAADVKGFDDEAALLVHYDQFGKNDTILAVIFDQLSTTAESKQFKYTIRPYEKYITWDTDSLFHQEFFYVPDYGSVTYINRGFISLQLALDTSFIEMTSKQELPIIMLQEFPYPPYLNDLGFTDMFLYVLPIVTIFSFVFLCPAVIKRVVEEKQTGIKELMKMMGLQSWMLWLGWFLHAFMVNVVSICVITFVMKVALWDAKYPPIEHCSASLFFIFLLLYCAAGIMFCFAISSLFNKPTLAMVVGVLLWILTLTLPSSIVEHSHNMKWGLKILFGIFPNMALSYGYNVMSLYESIEVGAQWSNLFKSPNEDKQGITMGNVLIMFIVEIIFYMLFTIYLENIKPGPYGLAKPLHFPVLYIKDKIFKRSQKVRTMHEVSMAKDYCKLEAAPDLNVGIRVERLCKKYGKQTVVNDLSIDIYQGQITALLGHNGAGKTTTMHIITGMINPSDGTVYINNKDISCNLDAVRSSLGLCPQHNLQFTDLTVMEHLIFFGMLKGLSRVQAIRQADDYLNRLCLASKKNAFPLQLSGGMRRKLAILIAIIGNSKVLILDEPTSGLDPEARRDIWDLLQTLRGDRTIIITTHFMEEADVLGDRIAIMDHGSLICYGTSMYLKKEYGAGYHLTIIRDKEMFDSSGIQAPTSQLDSIVNAVKADISDAKLQCNNGNNLTFLLPNEAKPKFTKVLLNLEEQKDKLGILNLSMSVTTLEEVFLRVGAIVAEKEKFERTSSIASNDSQTSIKLEGWPKSKEQYYSLLQKRFWVTKHNWKILLIQVAVAIALVIVPIYLSENTTDPSTQFYKPFNFVLNQYGSTKVYYGGTGNDDGFLSKMEDFYSKLVPTQDGQAIKVASVSDAIIQQGIKNIEYYKKNLVVAAEFNKTENEAIINAMYSNGAVHGAPISLNLLMNALLKSLKGQEYSITTANAPLPSAEDNFFAQASEWKVAILWFMLFPLGILFFSGNFVLVPQIERATSLKQLQIMCIRPLVYWFWFWMYDLMLYILVTILIALAVVLYMLPTQVTMIGWKELEVLCIILIVYGFCVIPYSYIFSYTKTAAGGFASFLMTSLFISVVLTLVVLILKSSGEDYYENIGNILEKIFSFYPQFGLAYSTIKFSRKAVRNHNWNIKTPHEKMMECYRDYHPCCDSSETAKCRIYQSYFAGDHGICCVLSLMALSSLLYFTIILLLDAKCIRKRGQSVLIYLRSFIRYKKLKEDQPDGINDDEDVKKESLRVDGTLKSSKRNSKEIDDLLLVHKLKKIYTSEEVVKGISFGIKAGDCFGLLGVNGAGKTTTFNMLTSNEPVTGGDAMIITSTNPLCISKDSLQYSMNIGYCPQFDAINEVLTGRQMLEFFARLRGMSDNKEVEIEVNSWINRLGLTEYADKSCGKYSGGNKRKLSMAIALIGSPLLVMLDEPTSGVDPVSRRKLWDTLSTAKEEQKLSVLLTSHSMDECEALCNKLAIMKDGQLECYGTIPSLKKKYDQGFTVMLKLRPVLSVVVNSNQEDDDSLASQSRPLSVNNTCNSAFVNDSEEVKKLMFVFGEMYKGSSLRDKHSGLLHYHIKDLTKKWSTLFREIEELKQTYPIIEDYIITETTLEGVFLSIARSNVSK